MTDITIFEKAEFGKIRTTIIDGKPWFMAKDVASALGYKYTSYAINAHCKGVGEIQTPTSGGMQTVKIIPESDLYRLILKSQLPSAEKFQDWVTSEVLPSIRKTGSYTMGSTVSAEEKTLPSLAIQLEASIKMASLLGLDKNQAILTGNKVVRKTQGVDCMALCEITHLHYEPNIQYFTPTELGNTMNLSAMQINKLLEEKQLQKETRDHKNKLKWVVTEAGKEYSRLFDTGKKRSDGTPIQQVKWPQRALAAY